MGRTVHTAWSWVRPDLCSQDRHRLRLAARQEIGRRPGRGARAERGQVRPVDDGRREPGLGVDQGDHGIDDWKALLDVAGEDGNHLHSELVRLLEISGHEESDPVVERNAELRPDGNPGAAAGELRERRLDRFDRLGHADRALDFFPRDDLELHDRNRTALPRPKQALRVL
jgi:hypothetical protein